jgi:hypothetical protein
MAHVCTHLLTEIQNIGSATSFTTSSTFQLGANELGLITLILFGDTLASNPTLTQGGMTWALVASVTGRLFMFRAMGASPTDTAVVVTRGGSDTWTGITVIADKITGTDTGGSLGATAVHQALTGASTSASSLSISYADAWETGSGGYSAWRIGDDLTVTPRTNWDEVTEYQWSGSNRSETQARVSGTDTAASMSVVSAANLRGIALEILAAAASAAADRGMPRGMNRGMNRGIANARHYTKQNHLWMPRERRIVVPVGINLQGV